MTRINLVPVEELSDQHLLAEYRELPRVIKQKIDTSNAPEKYCLGKGHVKWAKKHSLFCLDRYKQLCNEMVYRNFNISYGAWTLEEFYLMQPSESIMISYKPNEKDIELSRNRIIEKIQQKPDWYRWTNRLRPSYAKR